MFNRKIKREVEVLKREVEVLNKIIRNKDDCIKGLVFRREELEAEIKRLKEFNKKEQ